MSKNVKHLIKIYDEYKTIKGYSDGGKVKGYYDGEDVQSDTQKSKPEKSLADKLKDYFSTRPTQTQQVNPDKAKSFSNSFNSTYSEGGKVEKPHNKANLHKLKESFDSFLKEEGYYDGGPVQGFADGGGVQPDPTTGNIDPNSPEGLELIKNANYPTPAYTPNIDSKIKGDEQLVDSDINHRDKSEDTKSAEDKLIEEPYADEELAAKLKEEKPDEKVADDEDSEDEEDDSEPETAVVKGEPKKDEEPRKVASNDNSDQLQYTPSQNQPNALQTAQRQRDINIAMQGFQKNAALAAAGLTKTNPDQRLKIIDQQDQYVNLPVQKYQEQIANLKHDPNSDYSKQYAAAAAKLMGIDPSKLAGMSGDTLDKIVPLTVKKMGNDFAISKLNKQIESKEDIATKNRESREKIADKAQKTQDQRNKAYEERTKSMGSDRHQLLNQRQFDGITKDISNKMSNSPVGQDLMRTNKVFVDLGVDPNLSSQDIDKIPDAELNKKNKIQVIEAALGVNKYLTGSSAAPQNTLNHLIPNNVNMKSTEIMDYINNKLNPAQQASALRAYLQMSARGRDRARENFANIIKVRTAGQEHLFNAFPDQVKSLNMELENQGFGDNLLSPTTQLKKNQSSDLSIKAAKYKQYLATGGTPIPEAEAELKKAGVL